MQDSVDSTDHLPSGPWVFDSAVAACFDDMLERSIPLYQEAISLCCRLAVRHLPPGGQPSAVLDLGCSTGNTLAAIAREASSQNVPRAVSLIGVDRSPEMLARAKDRLGQGAVLIEHDLREPLPYRCASSKPRVVFLMYAAQFVPLEHRARLYREIRSIISSDGALFVAEKLRGQSARFQGAISEEYRAWKISRGYSHEAVDTKARSLEGVLVSLSAPETKLMISTEGFEVEEIARYLGFATYYCLPRGNG